MEQMTNEISEPQTTPPTWRPVQVYVMATICLALGIALGYLFRGSETRSSAAAPVSQTAPQPGQGMMQQMPTLEQMKQMADKKAEPLLAQLKTDPNNAGVLIQVARIYEATHQFQQASGYFQKALSVNPCLLYTSDAADE